MRFGSMTTKPRRGKANFSTVEAVLLLFVTTGSYFSADLQAKNAASKIAPLSPANGDAAAHRVETDKKGRCEEHRFDNRSGRSCRPPSSIAKRGSPTSETRPLPKI